MFSLTDPKKLMKREVLTVRKEHECYHCPNPILPKTQAVNLDIRHDGKLYAYYLHPECAEQVENKL